MSRGKDRNVRSEHHPIADRHEPAIEDAEVEVCVEAGADGDVAAVVYLEGRLDVGFVVGDVAEEVLESLEALFA